jgi:TonB family protein
LVHVELGVVIGLLLYLYAPRDADLKAAAAGSDRVEIGMVDDDTARRILAELEKADEKRKEEEAKKEEEQKESPGQVVELPKPREETRPDKARFAAEYNSSVAKETKKNGAPDKNAALGSNEGRDARTQQAQPAAEPSPQRQGAKGEPTPKLLAMREPSKPNPLDKPQPGAPGPGPTSPASPSPDKESGPPDGDGAMMPSGKLLLKPPGGGGGAVPSPGSPALMPTEQQMARAVSNGTDDYLRDIDEGDETALNAKKWKHAAFFNRVKQQVRNHWRPAEVYRQHDPTFRIYGQRDRFTLLRVQLKPDGSLANVGLETPSGVDFLDDEAIEAFKQAQPFPNPPKQLVEQGTGLISFRFGFYFEIGGAPRMKVFRYDQM